MRRGRVLNEDTENRIQRKNESLVVEDAAGGFHALFKAVGCGSC